VDTKKKELVGAFKNAGRRWLPKGKADEVSVHDFPHLGEGKAIHTALTISRATGLVNVGVTSRYGGIAVESIRRWWRLEWKKALSGSGKIAHLRRQRRQQRERQRAWKLHLQAAQ